MKMLNEQGNYEDVDDKIVKASIDWVVRFVNTNRTTLEKTGVLYAAIYEKYMKEVQFPLARKSFCPILHTAGLSRLLRKGLVYYVFVN